MRYLFLTWLALLLPAVPAQAVGGVVSAADPRAAEAGRSILRAGGSATDAALATMVALSVVEPQSSGIGGGGFFVRHDPKGRIDTVDGRETAPAAATPDRFLGADGKPLPFFTAVPGGRSVGVPGNIRLMAEAHRRWGKLPWARLFEPAIRLAEGGFAVSASTARMLSFTARRWQNFPETAALYAPGGVPRTAGATMTNPQLGRLLREIAAQGPDAFYRGDTATAIAAAARAGVPAGVATVSAADLAGYRAKRRPAVCGRYRGYRICGMGPPSSGATTILGMLGLLERFDLGRMGAGDAAAWHLIAEAMRLAYADREAYLADSDFVKVPVAGLTDRRYLAGRSRLIDPARTLGAYPPGAPPGARPRTLAQSSEVEGTTHFVAVDGRGEMVTMTSTVEGPFGSQLVARGMVLNNELTDFTFAPAIGGAPVANRVEGGKRPLSSMSPTLVYAPDGRLVLAVGSAGGKRIIMHVMKVLVGVIDWKLSASQAIALPNLYFTSRGLLVEKNTALAALAPQLTALGETVVPSELPSKLNAIERDGDHWRGAADPRSEGVALDE